MSKQLQGKAPFTMARTKSGSYVNVLAGDPVTTDITDEDRKRLLDEGYLEEIDVADPEPDDASDGPPAKSASKGDWEGYARSQGATDEDLDGKTKDDLIAAYGG